MNTSTYAVEGMTCAHCVNAVTAELSALDGVGTVEVDLVTNGASAVTVTSDRTLERAEVASALDKAGDYHLAGSAAVPPPLLVEELVDDRPHRTP